MLYFYKRCRFKRSIISSVQITSNNKTLKCSIKSMESMFNLRRFSEKMESYEIYIFVPNSQNLGFIISLNKILNLTNDASVMVDINANSKSQFHIIGAARQLFEKLSKKVVRFYTEKARNVKISHSTEN